GQALAVDLGPGLEVHRIAFLRTPGHRGPAAALLAQVLDHAVDVFLGDLGHRTLDLQPRDVDVAEVRHDLEGGHVGELVALGRLDPRLAGDAQRVVAHGAVEAFAQQAVEDLAADLLAEALLDHLRRHLARAEALDARGTGHLAQAAAHLLLQAVGQQVDGHPAPEVADGLD